MLIRYLFNVYRYTLAPLWHGLGGGCRFYPSCSHYAESVLRQHGWLLGGWLTLQRLIRCAPWHQGDWAPMVQHKGEHL